MRKRGFDTKAIVAIIIAHASVDMQTISLATLLPGILTAFNLDYATAAALVTANNVVIAVAQPIFGILGDRKPIRWLALAGCALCGIAMNAVTWLPSYGLIFAAAILSGIGSALFHPEGLAKTRAVSGEYATTGTSWFFLGGNIGFGGGPLLVGALTATFGPHGAVGMIIPTLIGCLLLASQMHKFGNRAAAVTADSEPQAAAGSAPAVGGQKKAVIAFVSFLMLLIVLRSVAIEGLKTFIPLYYAEETGKSAAEFAPLLASLSLAGIIGTLFSGPLADRFGRRNLMVGSTALGAAALFVFLRTDGLAQLLAMSVFGIAMTAPWTITVTMVQDAMPKNLGLAGGLTLGTAYGAAGIGVGLLGVLANATGLAFTLQFITWIPLLVIVMSLFVPERVRGATQMTPQPAR
jgi:FSR family fosmidomycin resistance protein-like MFS transporter